MSDKEDDFFKDWDVISVYSRENAIADGVLVDITGKAKEAGFLLHTVASANFLSRIDIEAQLADILKAFREQIKKGDNRERDLCTSRITGKDGNTFEAWLHIGGGDHGEPVLTLMLPEDW